MSDTQVRVRFAPSPTGPLHLGGMRAALYNYLFAKKNGGDFILRIEDTDQTRFVQGAEQYIMDSLEWAGIVPNEGLGFGEGPYGPYRQSDRHKAGIYKPFIEQLLQSGHAYYAFDTPIELEAMRERLEKTNQIPAYNHVSREYMKNSLSLPKEKIAEFLEKGEYVIRVKIPRNEEIRFYDEIRGWIVVNSDTLDDKVLCKSDGMPTYHLANIVDDYLMKISHVIRGEEWLPSCPLHILLYRFFGWQAPKFAHLPLILKPHGNGKLSKRDGDRLGFSVFPLNWLSPDTQEISIGYRERGFFPEPFLNMLAFLGWHPGGNVLKMSKEEMIQSFSLERVNKSGAKFDADKANWYNAEYLKSLDDKFLAQLMLPLLEQKKYPLFSLEKLTQIAHLTKERAQFIPDLIVEDFFFVAPENIDALLIEKKWQPNSAVYFEELITIFKRISDWKNEKIEEKFKIFLQEKNLKTTDLLPLFRLSVTGKDKGPSMFGIAEVLGQEEVLKRMQNFLKKRA